MSDSRARRRTKTFAVGAFAGLVLLPFLSAALPAAAAPAPLALGEKTAFFDDFESGLLDGEKWQLPTTFGVERARMRPWASPGQPVNDSSLFHLSDSLYPLPGRYANATHSALETTWIDLTEANAGARLLLNQRYDIDPAEDAGLVFLRTESRGWAVLAPDGGYPTADGFAGFIADFEVATFDLAGFAGSRVKLAFELDAGDDGRVGDGWQVDSITVTFATTVPAPDLRLLDIELYNSTGVRNTTGVGGDVLTLIANVSNVGNAPTTTAVPVFFFDGPVGTGRFLGQAALGSVSPGVLGTAALSAVLDAGVHTVSAVVDPGGILNELSTVNNRLSASFALVPAAGVDLALLGVTYEVAGAPTDGARPGDQVLANFTVTNAGSQALAGAWTFGVYLDTGTTLSLIAEQARASLQPSEVRILNLTFSALGGNLTLVAQLDHANAVDESNEANNEVRRSFQVTAAPPVNLRVDSLALTRNGQPVSDAYEGDLISLRAVVRNVGTGSVPSAFSVGLFLGDPDAGGRLILVRTVPGGLAPNATADVRGTWVAEAGQRTLYAYADLGRTAFEASEADNKGFATLHVEGDLRANLAVDSVVFKVRGNPVNATRVGATVVVEVSVRNTGLNSTVAGVVTMSAHNPWVSPLAPGVLSAPLPAQLARNTVTVVTFEWTAQAGTAVFRFLVDKAYATDESSEFDNLAVRSLPVSADSPDLSVSAVSVKSVGVETDTLYPQLNVTVQAEVTNSGLTAVDVPFLFELWAGEPGTFGAVRLANRTVQAPMDPGETATLSVVWLAGLSHGGADVIVAVADPEASVIEADQANNRASKDVNFVVHPPQNLAVEGFKVMRGVDEVASATEGDALRVEATVRNDSPAPFLGGAVFEIRNGDAVVFSAPVARLEPGASITFRANWTAVAGASLRAIVDSLAAVDETNEVDNLQTVSLSVAVVETTPWALYAGVAAIGGAVGIAGVFLLRRRRKEVGEAPATAGSATPPPAPPRIQGPAAPSGTRPAPAPGASVARSRPGGPVGAPPLGQRPPPRPGQSPPPRPGAPMGPPRPGQGPPQRPGAPMGPPRPGQGPPPRPEQGSPQRPGAPMGPPRPGQAPPPRPGGPVGPPRPRQGPPPGAGRAPPPAGPSPPPASPTLPAPPETAPAAPFSPSPPPGAACPNCHSPVEVGWILCASCGASLAPGGPTQAPPSTPKCPSCGDPTEAGWSVCPNCGAALTSP